MSIASCSRNHIGDILSEQDHRFLWKLYNVWISNIDVNRMVTVQTNYAKKSSKNESE